ncbi:hypothetical protein J3R83DRAFT_6772 [Lanmaoa asiatica]|nr:hypothetical protein J3R83DRAFT_6772 [Lanmaoa asiatica]
MQPRWKTSKQKEWYGFYSELALYKSEQYLRPLQGDVVPHIIGVHVMPETVSMTMEMPHSSFWIESSPSMPHALKERVIAAFEKIHGQGVLHGDPELRHMLIGADGKVMIIDFGMSRAIREHTSVKYKLDYMGARQKEGGKVDDYLRRVRRNRKISELWKRRANGERVGPIPQYEEDPEEYELDPPVNAQDFQEDWITASDDSPMRSRRPWSDTRTGRRPDPGLHVLHRPDIAIPVCHAPITRSPQPILTPRTRTTLSRVGPTQARRSKRRQSRHVAALSSPSHRCGEDDLLPLSARHIEGTSMRRDYVRHKHLKNTYISSLSNDPNTAATFPSSIDVPENSRSLEPEEYRRIQESRRQAMLQYSRAPKGILKRRRDADDVVEPNNQVVAAAHPPCKKLRFSDRLVPPSSRGRTPFPDSGESVGGPALLCTHGLTSA